MRDLISGLLQYSRINREEKPFEPVDCKNVMSEVIANLNNMVYESKAIITTEDLPVINANYMQMVQLLQNLVGNAIKFKGKETPPEVKVSYKKVGHDHQFAVGDNGIGIAEEHRGRIFEIFQRLHPIGEYPGTGIGLAICKKIIERFKGKIWVESAKDEGTTFYFTIPDNL
jgi:light-regulated signal transduction histidine kinase (bacteriophytochrome)